MVLVDVLIRFVIWNVLFDQGSNLVLIWIFGALYSLLDVSVAHSSRLISKSLDYTYCLFIVFSVCMIFYLIGVDKMTKSSWIKPELNQTELFDSVVQKINGSDS